MKFIHLADVHLGLEPESGNCFAINRKQEIWEAFFDIISLCERDKIDLLLISGDLFEGQPSLEDVKEVSFAFGRLSKTKVVMIAGNHDCLLPDSHYFDAIFPDNVTFLMSTEGESVVIEELNVEVFGASYEKSHISESRYDSLRPIDNSRINILLAHGNINGGDKSIPISKTALENAGFDYIALGHLHTRINVCDRIAYTGGFEPFERKEVGPKGYIAGEISKSKDSKSIVSWNFVSHAKRQYMQLQIDISSYMTDALIGDKILSEMKLHGMNNMYIANFVGVKTKNQCYSVQAILKYVRKCNGLLFDIIEQND